MNNQGSVGDRSTAGGPTPQEAGVVQLISLDDLLSSQSDVLNRIARDFEDDEKFPTGHQSSTSGHRSGGSHSSHSSIMP